MKHIAIIAFAVILATLCGAAAYRIATPLWITVDYPRSVLSETGLFVCLRVGAMQRVRMAYYATPLDFESDLVAWKLRDDVRVVEVTE